MENEVFEVLDMPEWKSKLLNAFAWILGFRGEEVYVITLTETNHE